MPSLSDYQLERFKPDAIELRFADCTAALAMLAERRPDLGRIMDDIGGSFVRHFGTHYEPLLKLTQKALGLSFVRMAYRHGSWGGDFHAYHNEEHTLELLNARLARVRLQLGWAGMEAEEWMLLALFSTCHDLRQREETEFVLNVGANERASIAETHRILSLAGFDRQQHAEFFDTLGLMIAGSTFDARPDPVGSELNSADCVSSGGSLSGALVREFEREEPNWRSIPTLRRRHRLMLVCSDLDTANVGEPFTALARSGERLIREREMRIKRSLLATAGAEHVREFLTDGQELYFFKLHRFVSDIGNNVFQHGKTLNAPKLKKLTDSLRDQFPSPLAPEVTGEQIIVRFIELAQKIA